MDAMKERIIEEGMWVFQGHLCFVVGICVCFQILCFAGVLSWVDFPYRLIKRLIFQICNGSKFCERLFFF